MFRSSKFFIVLLVLIFASAAFAFANSNTIPVTPRAGDGVGTISGYDVTNVDYVLDGTNPSYINSVTFTLNAAASMVKISLVNGGTLYSCTNTSGTNWSCDTTVVTQATVSAANELRVIATE